jgi:prevent-host-death family protein
MEKLVEVDDIRDQIERVLEDVAVRGDHVIVEDHGEAVAVMVPVAMYKKWAHSRDEFFDMFEQMARDSNLSPEEADELADEAVRAVRSRSA